MEALRVLNFASTPTLPAWGVTESQRHELDVVLP